MPFFRTMKNNYFITTALVLLALLTSCRSSRTAATIIKDSAAQTASANVLSDIIDTCEFIPLETSSDESLVGRVSKIIKYRDQFYIATDNNRILVFNADGSFSRRIDRLGRGPQEYADLTDFDIADDRIIVLSPQKIIVYTLDGTYETSISFDFNGLNLKAVDNYYLLRSNKTSFLRAIDIRSGKIGSLQVDMQENMRLGRNNCFLPFDRGVLIQQGQSNTFCYYSGNTPDEVSEITLLPDPDLLTSEQQNQMLKDNTPPKQTMILDMAAFPGQYYCAVGNPTTKEVYLRILDMENRCIAHSFSPETTDDLSYIGLQKLLQYISLGSSPDGFLTYLRPAELREAILRHGDDGTPHYLRMKELILDRVQDEDNPVLVEFRFKPIAK